MNRPDTSARRSSDAIRSEIDQTRERMDHTIDALTERLKGRHLVDEVLGYLRSNGNGRDLRQKITDSAGTAMHAVVDAVKAHPLPVMLMAAGVAWFAYEKKERERSPSHGSWRGSEDWPDSPVLDPQTSEPSAPGTSPYDESGSAGGVGDKLRGKAASMREGVQHAASGIKTRAREGVTHLRERAGESLAHLRVRAGDTGARMQERTRELARRTRDNISDTVHEHPLESGLSVLAFGLIAGLLTPTPRPLRDTVAPAGRRIRERVQEAGADLAERGRKVAEAATAAVKDEAEKQGLTPEAIAAKAQEKMDSSGEQRREGEGDFPSASSSSPTAGTVTPAGSAPWVPPPSSSPGQSPTTPRPGSPA